MLFVYNCNPLATMPNQNRVLEGLRREDLFTVVFEQVITDTARFADVLLPATTFVENYDIARGYGPISLQVVRPAIEPVGEARPNPAVFSDLSHRLGIGAAEEETDTLIRIAGAAAAGDRQRAARARRRHAAVWRPADPVRGRLSAHAGPEDRSLPGRARGAGARRPLRLPARPGDGPVPARAHFSGEREDRVIDARRAARAPGHAADAPVGRGRTRPRHRRSRAHLQRRSARCTAPWRSRRTSARAPSACRRACGARAPSTARRRTRSSPDTLTDLGGGACFNDARVQVASLGQALRPGSVGVRAALARR